MRIYIITLAIALSFIYNVNSQDTKLAVTYKITSQTSSSKIKYDDQEVNAKVNEVLTGVEKNLKAVDFTLYCNEYSSIYFLNKKLQIEEDFTYKMASTLGGSGVYYKNIKTKTKINQKDGLGEKFNVIYNYDEDKWIIKQETKMINGFKCYKATTKREEYNYLRKVMNVFEPEVWFTPEIPLPFGPKGFDGLPGLVLEATNNGKTFIYASKIVFNPDDLDQFLKKPKGGTDILKDEYLKALAASIND